jgi:hypothetical protein
MTTILKAKVLYNYQALAANQISLIQGQIINVTMKGNAGGWSSGEEKATGIYIYIIKCFVKS